MKVFATGRKNWYFFGSDEAGEQASIMLSILSIRVRNGVEPRAYLNDVVPRLVSNLNCDVDALLPQRWKPASSPTEIETGKRAPDMAPAATTMVVS